MRACEHCDNPDKANWTSRCLYKGSYPSRRAFVLSTFDAPCALDAYDDRVEERRKRNRLGFWIFWITLFVLIVLPLLVLILRDADGFR